MEERKVTTKKEREKIEALAKKGTPDIEIQKITGLTSNKVSKVTTTYWKRLMKLKESANEKVD